MPENISHSISYTQTLSTVENRWIKTVQEEQALSEAATVAEVARLIDQLYGLDACTQGLSGGGEAADGTNTPAEETFDSAAAAFMGNICESDEYWIAHILVMVSHPLLPERPVLQTESAEIVATEPVQRRVNETVELSSGQSSLDLAWPYAGGLSVNLPDGITASVKGSTLNLSRPIPATRHLRLSYQTSYQRVSLQVPVEQASPAPDTSIARGTPQEAALIAFWGNLASLCAPEPPERDESSQTAIDKLCSRRYSDHTKDKECTRTVEYYKRCKCSGTEALGESRQEQEDCSCGKRSPGSHLGLERRLEGYTDCDEKDEELADPEYYKEQCCKPPQGRLPSCSEEREEYKGGEGIEGGAAYYRTLYGANVRMEAVTPEGGSCGEKIRQWIVEPLDCCSEVEEPLQADSGNPIKVNKGDRITLRVQGGRRALPGQEDHPLEWTATGGLVFEKTGTASLREGTAEEVLIAQENICHQPTVVVDDGCKPVTLQFEGVDDDHPELSERDIAVWPETTFQLSVAKHGVAPFKWYCNDQGVEILSQSENGDTALIKVAGPHDWCFATVYCSDVCGKTAPCTVRNAQTGKYAESYNYQKQGCYSQEEIDEMFYISGGIIDWETSKVLCGNASRATYPDLSGEVHCIYTMTCAHGIGISWCANGGEIRNVAEPMRWRSDAGFSLCDGVTFPNGNWLLPEVQFEIMDRFKKAAERQTGGYGAKWIGCGFCYVYPSGKLYNCQNWTQFRGRSYKWVCEGYSLEE